MAILTYSQQQQIKPISANNEYMYSQIEKEVEEVELRKLLGIALLQDIQAVAPVIDYTLLLDGTSFTNKAGQTVSHKGLRYVIAYLAYSRYLGRSFVSDTFTGFTQKLREESETLTEGQIKRLQEENREIALTEWELIKEYLDLNSDIYTLWKCSTYNKLFTPRITGLKRTEYGG